MIYIEDNFLQKELIKRYVNRQKRLSRDKTPGKSFWVKEPHESFIDYMVNRIS